MLNRLYRTALWSIILTALVGRAPSSLPAVPVPTAPSLTTPDSQNVQAIDEPLCFMQTSSGNFVNLERLCNTNADIDQRNRAEAEDQSSDPNPVRFGTGRGDVEHTH